MNKLAKIFLTTSLLFPIFSGVNEVNAASQGDELVEYSKNFLGTAYRYGGTTPAGFDCSGFVSYIFSNYNISMPRSSAEQYKAGVAVSKNDLIPGDAVFFTTNGKGTISHAGIYIGDNKFIHSSTTKGVRIDSLNDVYYWKSRFVGAKRFMEEGTFKGLKVNEGQIGMIEIHKPMNLWQRDENNSLVEVRVVNPGEVYRVYSIDSEHGGQFGVGAGLYITNIDSHLQYYAF